MRWLLAVVLLGGASAGSERGGTVSGTVTATEGEGQKKLRADIRYAGPGIELRKAPDPSPAVVHLEGVPASKAEGKTLEMRQDGLEFRPRVLAVQAGSTVRFPNGDNLHHNVFSYSAARRFDLGRYPKGESKDVLFDRKGRVDVRCDIHRHMRAYIHVFDDPHFALAKEDGTFAISGVPPGKYTLVVWKEFFEPVRRPVEVAADGARVDVRLSRLDPGSDGRTAVAGCCEPR